MVLVLPRARRPSAILCLTIIFLLAWIWRAFLILRYWLTWMLRWCVWFVLRLPAPLPTSIALFFSNIPPSSILLPLRVALHRRALRGGGSILHCTARLINYYATRCAHRPCLAHYHTAPHTTHGAAGAKAGAGRKRRRERGERAGAAAAATRLSSSPLSSSYLLLFSSLRAASLQRCALLSALSPDINISHINIRHLFYL